MDPYPPSRPTAAESPGADRAVPPVPDAAPALLDAVLRGRRRVQAGRGHRRRGSALPPRLRRGAASAGSTPAASGFHGFYQYDRLLPTLLLTLRGRRAIPPAPTAISRSRELNLRATVPLRAHARGARSRSPSPGGAAATPLEDATAPEPLDLGGIETAWALTTVRQFPYSISPAEGVRAPRGVPARRRKRWAATSALGKATADLRALPPACSPTTTRWPCALGGRDDVRASRRSSARSRWAASRTARCSTSCRRTTRSCADTRRTRSAAAGSRTPTRSTAFPSPIRSAGTGRCPFFLRHLHARGLRGRRPRLERDLPAGRRRRSARAPRWGWTSAPARACRFTAHRGRSPTASRTSELASADLLPDAGFASF